MLWFILCQKKKKHKKMVVYKFRGKRINLCWHCTFHTAVLPFSVIVTVKDVGWVLTNVITCLDGYNDGVVSKLVLSLFLFYHTAWHLELPWLGAEPAFPAVKVGSLNHWTTKAVHCLHLMNASSPVARPCESCLRAVSCRCLTRILSTFLQVVSSSNNL